MNAEMKNKDHRRFFAAGNLIIVPIAGTNGKAHLMNASWQNKHPFAMGNILVSLMILS